MVRGHHQRRRRRDPVPPLHRPRVAPGDDLHLLITTVFKTALKVLERPDYARSLAFIELDKIRRNLFGGPSDGRADRIRQCSIRITDLCNLRCHTCGQWGDGGFLHGQSLKELKSREVPTERYLELLADLARHGHAPSVYLWGGEPMLHDGTLRILREAARLGMPPSIATNGTGIAEHARELVDAPMFLVQLSIDGPDGATHNASRPGTGSATDNFATVRAAADRVAQARKERGRRLPLIASLTTINHLNQGRLVETYDSLAGVADICVFYLAWWIDERSAQQHSLEFQRRFGFTPRTHRGWIGTWTPSDYQVLARELTEIGRRAARLAGPAVVIMPHLTHAAQLERYYTDHDSRFGFHRCVSIFSAVEINANGDMSPCRDYHDFVVGNVKERTITGLFNDDRYRQFRLSLARDGLMPVCTRCCGLMGY
ncbi:MAG: radical SAM protein [Candidatus Riflebacteria bacterium]|nr:radical SAM protein [Candidatus Riflebacteria bacterium]